MPNLLLICTVQRVDGRGVGLPLVNTSLCLNTARLSRLDQGGIALAHGCDRGRRYRQRERIAHRRYSATIGGSDDRIACPQIGRAHVGTPVTNAHLVCRLLLETKNTTTLLTI